MTDVGINSAVRYNDIAASARSFNKAPAALLGGIEDVTVKLLATRLDGEPGYGASPLRSLELRAPVRTSAFASDESGELGTEGTFVKLLAQLRMVVGSAGVESLNQRLDELASFAAARSEALGKLGEEIEALLASAEHALAEAELITGEAGEADMLAKQLRQLADDLAAKVDAMSPSDPDYAEAMAELNATAGAAAEQEAKAVAAMASAADAVGRVQGLHEQISRLEAQLPVGGSASRNIQAQQLTGEALVTVLLGKLHALIAANSTQELEQQGEVIETQIRAAQKENAKRIKEYEAEIAKAEEMERKMGSWAKAIGWAIVAVSIGAGILTGGATLAFAGVGLAMMVADEVMEKPFISNAIGSVIETVLKPVMDFFGGMVTDLLKSLGVDEETAKLIGAIGGALLTVVAVALVVILGKGAAANLMSKVGSQLAKVLARIVPDAAKTVGRTMSKSVSQAISAPSRYIGKKTGEKGALAANQMTTVAAGAQFINTAAQGVGNAVVAEKLVGAARISAELDKAIVNNQMLTRLMELILEAYTATGNTLERARHVMSDVISDGTSAATQVVGNIRK